MSDATFGSSTSLDQGPPGEDPQGMGALAGYGVGLTLTALFIALSVGIQNPVSNSLDKLAFNAIEAFSTLAFATVGTYVAAEHVRLRDPRSMVLLILCIFGGFTTAVGGGIIRDMITHQPIACLHDITLPAAGALGAMIGVFLAHHPSRAVASALAMSDSIAVAVAIIVGTNKGIGLQTGLVAPAATCCAMVCALLTSSGGGIVRDLFLERSPSAFSNLAFFLPPFGALMLVMVSNALGNASFSIGTMTMWMLVPVLTAANLYLTHCKYRNRMR